MLCPQCDSETRHPEMLCALCESSTNRQPSARLCWDCENNHTTPSKPGMWECSTEAFGGLFCYDCAERFKADNQINEHSPNQNYAIRIRYWEYDCDEVCDNCERACEL